jgi:hypothetical protein
VYVREGRFGKIRLWEFHKRPPKVHRVKGRLTISCP